MLEVLWESWGVWGKTGTGLRFICNIVWTHIFWREEKCFGVVGMACMNFQIESVIWRKNLKLGKRVENTF